MEYEIGNKMAIEILGNWGRSPDVLQCVGYSFGPEVIALAIEALQAKDDKENLVPMTLKQVREHIANDPFDARPLWVEARGAFFGSSGWIYANKSTADIPETGEVYDIASVEWLIAEHGDAYNHAFRCWREKPSAEQRGAHHWGGSTSGGEVRR